MLFEIKICCQGERSFINLSGFETKWPHKMAIFGHKTTRFGKIYLRGIAMVCIEKRSAVSFCQTIVFVLVVLWNQINICSQIREWFDDSTPLIRVWCCWCIRCLGRLGLAFCIFYFCKRDSKFVVLCEDVAKWWC